MSAAEVIEQIKALPADERAKVFTYLNSVNGDASSERQIRYMAPEKAKELSATIFSENAELFRKLAQ